MTSERQGEVEQSLEAFEAAKEIAEKSKDRNATKAIAKAEALLRKRFTSCIISLSEMGDMFLQYFTD